MGNKKKTRGIKIIKYFTIFLLLLIPSSVFAGSINSVPCIGGIRLEFVFFGLTLVGVAVFQKKTMQVALLGLFLIIGLKLLFDPDFSFVRHFFGDGQKTGEWHILLNLLGLLLGFAILAWHFEESKLPDILPNYLPDDWKGGFVLLLLVMFLATFLDSIASAMIGGAIAFIVFKGKVHVGYLACIVAASNGGGAGSVLGNTPTTMMWIDGVSPLGVSHAFIGSIAAFLIFGVAGSVQQDRFQRIQKDATSGVEVDWGRISIVVLMLVLAIVFNWVIGFPALGVWLGILIGALYRKTAWSELSKSIKGSIFLLALVTAASLMPVEDLPAPSWKTSFLLGLVSAVFDNIPLTKLCLDQGGYDWGLLAYSIGFGGSLIWFGSSAGVALSNMYPEAKSVTTYVKKSWYVSLAYVVGFFIMFEVIGWHPQNIQEKNEIGQKTQIEQKNQINSLKR